MRRLQLNNPALKELEDYLSLMEYTYSLGGPMYSPTWITVRCIRSYIKYLDSKYV